MNDLEVIAKAIESRNLVEIVVGYASAHIQEPSPDQEVVMDFLKKSAQDIAVAQSSYELMESVREVYRRYPEPEERGIETNRGIGLGDILMVLFDVASEKRDFNSARELAHRAASYFPERSEKQRTATRAYVSAIDAKIAEDDQKSGTVPRKTLAQLAQSIRARQNEPNIGI